MANHLRFTLRSLTGGSIALLAVVCAASCVDKDFRIDEVDKTVTIGDGTLSLPLGYVDEKSLDEIIGSSIGELTTDADGNYTLGYKGDGTFVIDGISEDGFSSGSQSTSTDISYPDMTIASTPYAVDETFNVKIPASLSSLGATVLPTDIRTTLSDSGEVGVSLELTIPSQVKSVERIYLGSDERGAQFALTFSLNGLAPINGGGEAQLKIEAPAGYEFWDGTNSAVAGASLTLNRTVASGATSATFNVWLRSIDTSERTITNGKMLFNEKIRWSITYDFTAKSGRTFNISAAPKLRTTAVVAYRDADVTLSEFAFDDAVRQLEENIFIKNIIKEIKSVSEVVLKNTRITVKITGIDWLSDALAEVADVKITLPEFFVLESSPELYFDDLGNIETTIAQLREGLSIGLSKIVIDEAAGTPDADGQISLDFAVKVALGKLGEELRVKASELLHSGTVSIGISLLDTNFFIESIAGKVSYEAVQRTSVDMSDIAKYDITVGDIDVSPLLHFAIDNPFSVPVNGTVELTPYKNGKAITANIVTVEGINIAAATRTESAHTEVVIAEAVHRGEYPSAQFIEADITRLFKGSTLPDNIDVRITAGTDDVQQFTIYAKESYEIACNYDVEIPLRFGKDFSLSYNETFNLEDTFDDLDKDITVGEIAVVANVFNSTPLNFRIDAQALDASGRPSEAQIVIDKNANTAFGSTDGKVRESEVVMLLSLGKENCLRTLADVKSLRLTLTATSPDGATGNISLNKNQTLAATLLLRISGGMTTDIDDL